MLRLIILALIAVAVAALVLRLLPGLLPGLRARLAAILRHPFVRQVLFGLVFRLIRLLIFRR
jgi:hypothetical protein